MNRLLSQLAEVSLSLQRTKEECDMIAKRCPPKPKERTQKQRCNGSCIEEVDRAAMKEDTTAVVRELESEEERAKDEKVEELIHMAQLITRGGPEQQHPAQGKTLGMITSNMCEKASCLWLKHDWEVDYHVLSWLFRSQ